MGRTGSVWMGWHGASLGSDDSGSCLSGSADFARGTRLPKLLQMTAMTAALTVVGHPHLNRNISHGNRLITAA